MIKRKAFVGFWILISLCLFAQETLNNESILKLCKAGLGEDTIVGIIKVQSSKFLLSSDDILALKNNGVTETIIAAMVAKGAGEVAPKVGASNPDPPSVTSAGIQLPDELGVYWLKNGRYAPVTPEILNLRTERTKQVFAGILANAKLNGWVTKEHSRTHVGPESDFLLKL